MRDPQVFEAEWWGSCANTFGEEAKQITYAHRMGLENVPVLGKWPVYDLGGRSVIDLGGGPVSMLLKTINGGHMTVIDPCQYPAWTQDRYEENGIELVRENAETYVSDVRYDEAWCYNVLQHVVDPEMVIATARRHAPLLRIFEWLETAPTEGHPHTLHADELNRWIGATGEIGYVDENGAVGLAYWGAL